MTPTHFAFSVTIPSDERLVAAVRQLTTHAAGYATLPAEAADQFAAEVERSTLMAITARFAEHAPVRLDFSRAAQTLAVVIACDSDAEAAVPAPSAHGPLTVEWSRDGTRHTCHIRQAIPA